MGGGGGTKLAVRLRFPQHLSPLLPLASHGVGRVLYCADTKISLPAAWLASTPDNVYH